MLLSSSTGERVELQIDGYQFASMSTPAHGDWDANWLVISGTVHDGRDTWTFRTPCLTTWEATDLLRFLREPHAKAGDSVEFTEPNLSLHVTATSQSTVTITVTFRGEAAAPSTADHDSGETVTAVALTISTDALRDAADAWATQLENHPQR